MKRSCGKRRFRDKKEALGALRMIAKELIQRATTPRRAYCCHLCRGWHLTSRDAFSESARKAPSSSQPGG